MFNSRIASIVLYILLALGAALLIIFFVAGPTPQTEGTPLEEPKFTDLALKFAYVYFAIAAVLAVLFPILDVIAHPKGAGGLLIAVLFFVGVFLLAYFLSSDKVLPDMVNAANVPERIKLVDTGLLACYIFGGVAFLGIFFTEISGIFNKN
ncbi:MAG: hypothetical protein JXK95_14405 [Bacteroidales bacterium]|nr:hypothetical protein [Bacteroidales bacterium]